VTILYDFASSVKKTAYVLAEMFTDVSERSARKIRTARQMSAGLSK
jgi:hypothetical protein